MNFIQKNPTDSKHEEYHDGEYEYWPLDSALKSKSISIPAAVVSGLELLAAAAAAGLLAAALAVLYVISSPLALSENSAAINANVYNNSDNQSVVYTLSTADDPETILQDGTLEENESTLFLEDLIAGTTYLLRYYDAEQKEIGDFRFTTPGEASPSQSAGLPGVTEAPSESVQDPPEPESTEPAVEEITEETTPETTEAVTEPATEPTEESKHPVYVPPAHRPPASPDKKPTKPNTEVTEPSTEATEPSTEVTEPSTETTEPSTGPTEPEITTGESDTGEVTHIPSECGDAVVGYYQFEEYHTFRNVPEGGYTIRIVQSEGEGENRTETEITEYTMDRAEDGTLFVSFEGEPIPSGRETVTEVILTTADGTEYISTNKVFPPELDAAQITVVKNEDGTHTFTATADVISDGTQEMECEATFYVTIGADGVVVPMTAESPNRYIATYTTRIDSDLEEETADIKVSAWWVWADPETAVQSRYHYCQYTP